MTTAGARALARSPESTPAAFYVTIRDGRDRTLYALGPFNQHTRALAWVERVRVRCLRAGLDGWADLGFGTARVPVGRRAPTGCLNGVLEVAPDDVGVTCRAPQRVPAAALDALHAVSMSHQRDGASSAA